MITAGIASTVDLRMDFFDTAGVFGPWSDEEMVGEALGAACGKVTIATKFGAAGQQDSSAQCAAPVASIG